MPDLRTVVALGGNAIAPSKHAGDIPAQFAQSRRTAVRLVDLIESGHHVLVTHGNGPQVGNILRRVEIASRDVYPIDLGLCVADTQAGMGYMICQCLSNEFRHRGGHRPTGTIVTTVLVDGDDPAFANPTKPIGPYLTADEAEHHRDRDRWQLVEVPGKGVRRVVPSPHPRRIVELDCIKQLYDAGYLLVACGGGGIPVIDRPGWGHEGVEAVIDKDSTAALLALGVGASLLVMVTDTPKVYVDYDKPSRQALDRLTISRARELLNEGQFPPGSMGPKIEAAIEFLTESSDPNAKAMICATDDLATAVGGETGTLFVRD